MGDIPTKPPRRGRPRPQLQIEFYERLIYRHSMRIVGTVEMDFDDIVATYRIKVWQALNAYDADHPKAPPVERFVFNCLKNMEKDLLKRKRRYEVFMDGLAPQAQAVSQVTGGAPSFGGQSRDMFEAHYLSVTADEVYREVEEDDLHLPSTLSKAERRIVVLLYEGYSQTEIRHRLGVERSEMDRTVKAIRTKLADWRPSSRELGDIRQPEVATPVAA